MISTASSNNDKVVIILSPRQQSPSAKVRVYRYYLDAAGRPVVVRIHMFRLKAWGFSSVLFLTGCVNLAPDYHPPELPVPQQFSLSHNGLVPDTEGWQDSGWRNFFTDPWVQQLIDEALRHNPDIKMAALKVQQARAQYAATNANRSPQLNGTSSAEYQGGLAGDNGTDKRYDAGLDLSFELDFFARLKNSSEAEKQNLFASEAARRDVYLLLVSAVSRSYFSQQQAQEQLYIALETRRNYQQAAALVEQQVVSGASNVLAMEQARGIIASTDADIAKRQGELSQATNALQLLLGYYQPQPLKASGSGIHLHPVRLPAHLSSEILRQRSDILQAEYQIKAANANIGVARAAFYPAINLTSGLSGSSSELTSLFDAGSGLWRFVPKIELPLFNGARNEANLTLANITQQQARVNYQQKIQNAFKQVADSLAIRESLRAQLTSQEHYRDSLNISLQRAQKLYSDGVVSYLNVLDAERSLFITRQAIVDLQYAQSINEVNLFAALGGGWKA